MRLELSDGSVHEVPCAFHAKGYEESSAEVRVVPGTVEHEELADFLFRAFWVDLDWRSWDSVKDDANDLTRRTVPLATHLLGDTREALLEELQQHADRFHPNVPLVQEEITVTSRDGRLQLTLNP